jgi:hypothetical protein
MNSPDNQSMRGGGDQNRVRLSDRLHARGDIRRVAEYVGVFTGAHAHHHRPRMDPDPRRQLCAPGLLVELRDIVDNRQAGTRGTLRVVVVGLGIAEERHNAVTKVLGDVAAEARYRFRGRALVAGCCIAPFLRVELRRDPGGPNQIAEQHR